MNYRIYQNITGWEYLTTVYEEQLNEVISSIDDSVYLLIIKHDIELNMDEPYYNGYAEEYKENIDRREYGKGVNKKVKSPYQ